MRWSMVDALRDDAMPSAIGRLSAPDQRAVNQVGIVATAHFVRRSGCVPNAFTFALAGIAGIRDIATHSYATKCCFE